MEIGEEVKGNMDYNHITVKELLATIVGEATTAAEVIFCWDENDQWEDDSTIPGTRQSREEHMASQLRMYEQTFSRMREVLLGSPDLVDLGVAGHVYGDVINPWRTGA